MVFFSRKVENLFAKPADEGPLVIFIEDVDMFKCNSDDRQRNIHNRLLQQIDAALMDKGLHLLKFYRHIL